MTVLFVCFRNEDLRILASDEFGIIPASTRLQVALATVANVEQNVQILCCFLCQSIKARFIVESNDFSLSLACPYSFILN